MSKQAIIVVDFQNDYLTEGSWPLIGIHAAVQKAAEVIGDARSRGVPIFHVRHESPEGAPFFVAGTRGAEIIPAVAPQNGEKVVVKKYPNAFRDTDLKARLDAEGVEDVVIVGAMTHMCIDASARAAADHGYNVTVVADATATRDAEFNGVVVPSGQVHAAFMAALDFAYGKVVAADDFLK